MTDSFLNPPRHPILGVRISAVNLPQAVQILQSWVAARSPHYVCCVPVHLINDCYSNPAQRAAVNGAGLVTPDGMPVVWLLRRAGHTQVSRVYGPDLLLAVCQASVAIGGRHYFYGGRPEVVERLVEQLQQRFPGLQVAGCESPPFRPLTPAEDDAAVARIQAARPDYLWVGIGSPRQELWMAEHVDRLGVPVLVGVGAAFDFLSGAKPQAPVWLQRSGLEWLFRLVTEPRRLWKRYLVGNPLFLWRICKERFFKKRVS